LVLWLLSPTIYAFFIWQIIISIVHVILVTFFLWRSLPKSNIRPQFEKVLLIRIWRFAAGMAGISFTSVILTQTDKIVLSKILPLKIFGYYVLATVVANTLYFFIGPVFSSLFPRFSQLVSINDQSGLKELYHKSCQLMSVMILPAAIVVSLFSSEILLLWTGDPLTVSNSHLIVSIYIIGTALNGLMNLPYALQIAHAWTKLSLYSNIISSLVQIPLIYFLSIKYGAIGTACAWVILNTGAGIIIIQIMHSKLLKGEKLRWYLKDVGIPMLSALLIASLWFILIPIAMSKVAMIIYILGASTTSLLAAIFATSVTRKWVFQNIGMINVFLSQTLGVVKNKPF